ncbi:MAG: NUDIX hydrolase [Bacilli bacterium]|nr:NUDIX hydrolase [Bacilli bacterium]
MEKVYNSEEEFLRDYDSSKFEKLSMTTDILIFSVSSEEVDNYRKTDKKKMSILLVKRDNYPFKDKWCLPGGFIGIDEDLDAAPKRILKKETNVDNIYLEQLYTFGSVNRDPRMRVVSTSYIALIDKNRLTNNLSNNASWFDITFYEEKDNIVDITLDNGNTTISFKIEKILREQTTDRYSFKILKNDSLAFDHPLVILSGIERLKNKIEYTDIVFNMMPEYFTLGELQQVYEVILGKKLLDPAFRRIIANKVEKTTKMKTGGGHRPSYLFRYKSK